MYATNAADYHLIKLANGKALPIASITYDPATFSVTIVPQAPLPGSQYVQIQVNGTGPVAIRDLAGNLLDGDSNGVAGSNYVASFAQGRKLKYTDSSGSTVTLQLKGPGYLEQVRDSSGNGVSLNLVGMVPHRTTLQGHIKVRHRRAAAERPNSGRSRDWASSAT